MPCLFSLRLLCLLVWCPLVFRVLAPCLLVLLLPSLRCCLSSLLVFVCRLVALLAQMPLFVLGLALRVLLRFFCFRLPLVALALGVRLLPVAPVAVSRLWLLVLAVCWWLFPLVLVLLVSLLRVRSLGVALARGVRWLLPSVAVVGYCCGFPLALVLPCGLLSPGLLLVRSALLAAGGSVLLFLLPRSCRFSSLLVLSLSLSQKRSPVLLLLANL